VPLLGLSTILNITSSEARGFAVGVAKGAEPPAGSRAQPLVGEGGFPLPEAEGFFRGRETTKELGKFATVLINL